MRTRKRSAYVAGKFYPGSASELSGLIEEIKQKEKHKYSFDPSGREIIGGILPHAGHIYSGYQTIHFFEALRKSNQEFDDFIILHPIHRGGSIDFASDENDSWETPFGQMFLDDEFIKRMDIPRSKELHRWEHSAEVILPFIQAYKYSDKKIVPVGISRQHPDNSKKIAERIHRAVMETERRVCILASSDFSHFVDPQWGEMQDQKAIDRILGLDADGLFRTVMDNNISICGYGPIMSLIWYCKLYEWETHVDILARGHSGQVYPSKEVVDYISIIFYK